MSNLMYHNGTLEFMDEEVIRQLFSKINIWKSGDKRAPHKPLLLLLTLARCREGKPRFNSYIDIDKELKSLLIDFGPVENNYRTYYPFWRLQKDGLWEVKADRAIKVQSGGDVSKSDLIKHNATGGFKEEIYITLYNNYSVN